MSEPVDRHRRHCLAALSVAPGALATELVAPTSSSGEESALALEERFATARAPTDGQLDVLLNPDVRLPDVVSVRVRARLPELRTVTVFIDEHEQSWIARFESSSADANLQAKTPVAGRDATAAETVFSIQLKIERPCAIKVLADSGRGWYRQQARVDRITAACS